IQNAAAFARPFALPPGTPKDRVLALRKAFQETLKDRAFLAEADKAKLTLDPATAEELDRMVTEAFALEPALVAKLQDILYKSETYQWIGMGNARRKFPSPPFRCGAELRRTEIWQVRCYLYETYEYRISPPARIDSRSARERDRDRPQKHLAAGRPAARRHPDRRGSRDPRGRPEGAPASERLSDLPATRPHSRRPEGHHATAAPVGPRASSASLQDRRD